MCVTFLKRIFFSSCVYSSVQVDRGYAWVDIGDHEEAY